MARTDEEDDKRIEQAVEELGKYFDEVQIFATRYSPKDEVTTVTHRGKGNHYSRYGVVANWLLAEDERRRVMTRKTMEAEDE